MASDGDTLREFDVHRYSFGTIVNESPYAAADGNDNASDGSSPIQSSIVIQSGGSNPTSCGHSREDSDPSRYSFSFCVDPDCKKSEDSNGVEQSRTLANDQFCGFAFKHHISNFKSVEVYAADRPKSPCQPSTQYCTDQQIDYDQRGYCNHPDRSAVNPLADNYEFMMKQFSRSCVGRLNGINGGDNQGSRSSSPRYALHSTPSYYSCHGGAASKKNIAHIHHNYNRSPSNHITYGKNYSSNSTRSNHNLGRSLSNDRRSPIITLAPNRETAVRQIFTINSPNNHHHQIISYGVHKIHGSDTSGHISESSLPYSSSSSSKINSPGSTVSYYSLPSKAADIDRPSITTTDSKTGHGESDQINPINLDEPALQIHKSVKPRKPAMCCKMKTKGPKQATVNSLVRKNSAKNPEAPEQYCGQTLRSSSGSGRRRR